MTLKNRLAQLEKQTQPQAQTNPYMTMPREDFINLVAAKIEAAERGEGESVDLSQAGEVMRAEIARRLDRLAEQANP